MDLGIGREFTQRLLDLLAGTDTARVMVAQVINEGRFIDGGYIRTGAVQKREGREAARDHQWHVVFRGDRRDDTGERVLLEPQLDIDVDVGPDRAAIESRGFLEGVDDAVEGLGLDLPAGVIRDVPIRNPGAAPQSDQGSLHLVVTGLGLIDDAPDRGLEVGLPDTAGLDFLDVFFFPRAERIGGTIAPERIASARLRTASRSSETMTDRPRAPRSTGRTNPPSTKIFLYWVRLQPTRSPAVTKGTAIGSIGVLMLSPACFPHLRAFAERTHANQFDPFAISAPVRRISDSLIPATCACSDD
jgi:hypothetical protein